MQIRISHYAFALSEPYQQGHVLTENEAFALNSVRAENIRNVMSRVAAKYIAVLGPGELLDQGQIALIQLNVTEYDENYAFPRKERPKLAPGSIQHEVRRVAEEQAEDVLRFNGLDASHPDFAVLVAKFVNEDTVFEEATRRISDRKRVAASSLEDL